MSDPRPQPHHDPVLTVTAGPHAAGPALITVTGELDFSTAADLRDTLDDTPMTAAGLVIDLTGLRYCDSTGLTVLVTAFQQAKRAGAPLALAGLNATLNRVFDIAGLHAIFPSYPTVDQAVLAI
ncbi:STAS domain-containing protein [Actinacidiphila epipremni]|uniref:STAS domain-containing protein n=1 Tax=Actinacidiphila epipremni TaxID=2053013 RepID=UPI002AFDFC2F|nr:STAS domain-containing protein [Actinacidiphila epipremni]